MKMMIKSRIKHTVSVVLSLVLVLCALFAVPNSVKTAYAEDVVSVSDEATLFKAVENGGTIMIAKNIRTSKCLKIPTGKTVVLDLNGKILNRGLTECQDIGSVIRVEPGAELTVRDASKRNHGTITGGASWNGGGICNHGTLTIDGGSISGNRALHNTYGSGAGIYSDTYQGSVVTLTINGGVIDNNEARKGGGVYCGKSKVTINSGTFRNNSATNGGAFYLANGADVKLNNTVNINCNKADKRGGAAYLAKGSSLKADSLRFFNNNSPDDTGYLANLHIYTEEGTNERILGPFNRTETLYTSWSQLKNDIETGANKKVILTQDLIASGSDKEITIKNATNVTVDLNGFTLNRNMSKNADHGGIFRIEQWAKLTIIDSSGNDSGKITGGKSINGGGICNHGTLCLKGGTVTGNNASKDGGGILTRVYGGSFANLEITGGIVENNRANYGAGIYVDGDCKANITNADIIENAAGTDGGGIYAHEKSNLIVANSAIENNNSKYGAAVYLKRAVATINKCRITDNSVSGHCGALFNNYYSTCTVNDSVFNNNTSPEKAGAILNNNHSTLKLNNTVLTNNKAATDGGALYINNDENTTYMDGCTFEKNEAKWGAGIYVREGASAYANLTSFTNNVAGLNGGAVWMGNNGNTIAEFTECTFSENSAVQHGGGVYTQGKGTLSIIECEMNSQRAETGKGGAIYAGDKDKTVIGLVNVDFYDNESKTGGGAIYANNAAVGLKGLCTIYRNYSYDKGNSILLTKNSYIANPGLYEGSRVYICPESKTVAREISEYQTRYMLLESQRPMAFRPERTVDTPIVASLFSKSGTSVIIVLTAAGVLACAIAVVIKKKNEKAGGAEDDDE